MCYAGRTCVEPAEVVWQDVVLQYGPVGIRPVVGYRSDALPHATRVILPVAAFKSLSRLPLGIPDGFLELVSGRFILQDVSRLERCTPLPDFAAYIRIKPGFLVGKNTISPGGDANGGAPVNVAADSVHVFMNIVRGPLKNVCLWPPDSPVILLWFMSL